MNTTIYLQKGDILKPDFVQKKRMIVLIISSLIFSSFITLAFVNLFNSSNFWFYIIVSIPFIGTTIATLSVLFKGSIYDE